MVTASAAMDKSRFNPDSKVPGGAILDVTNGRPIPNENGSSCGGTTITLARALEVSCNVAFAWLGLKVGEKDMRAQSEAYGFGHRYFTELDDSLTKQAISHFSDPPPGSDTLDPAFLALSAIGQYDVRATPLQMAMVVAGVANSGKVMKPYLVDEVQSPDLDVLKKTDSSVLSDAISPATARQLTEMMVGVVDQGTAVSAQIPGIRVAGKTGTAQSAPGPPAVRLVRVVRPRRRPEGGRRGAGPGRRRRARRDLRQRAGGADRQVGDGGGDPVTPEPDDDGPATR